MHTWGEDRRARQSNYCTSRRTDSLYSINLYGLPVAESCLKFIITKTTSESLGGILVKFCTNKNLPTIQYSYIVAHLEWTKQTLKVHMMRKSGRDKTVCISLHT